MAIIHENIGNVYSTLGADSPTVDIFGFDDVTRPVIVRGNSADLLKAFPFGEKHPTFEGMYCTGPSGGVTALPGNFTEGTIGWKGFLYTGRSISETLAISTREVTGPIVSSGSDFAGGTVPWINYVSPPIVPSLLNPETNQYWRFRLIERVRSITQQGVTIGTPDSPPGIPAPPNKVPPPAALPAENNGPDEIIDWSRLQDPTINYPYGWILRDFQVNSQFSLGTVALYYWTARWEYLNRYGP